MGGKFLRLHTNPLLHRHWLVDYLEHKIIVGDETGVIIKLIPFYLSIIVMLYSFALEKRKFILGGKKFSLFGF